MISCFGHCRMFIRSPCIQAYLQARCPFRGRRTLVVNHCLQVIQPVTQLTARPDGSMFEMLTIKGTRANHSGILASQILTFTSHITLSVIPCLQGFFCTVVPTVVELRKQATGWISHLEQQGSELTLCQPHLRGFSEVLEALIRNPVFSQKDPIFFLNQAGSAIKMRGFPVSHTVWLGTAVRFQTPGTIKKGRGDNYQ